MNITSVEIRDFPKGLMSGGDEVYDIVLRGIRNCVSLQACTWTRDGSLNTAILDALLTLNTLRELQINGNSQGHYTPDKLSEFKSLQSITVIMPNVKVMQAFPKWMEVTGSRLRSLTLICKASQPLKFRVL
jgi:hypothetical protein